MKKRREIMKEDILRECVCVREKDERQALSNSFFWLVLCVQLSPGCAHVVINHWEQRRFYLKTVVVVLSIITKLPPKYILRRLLTTVLECVL